MTSAASNGRTAKSLTTAGSYRNEGLRMLTPAQLEARRHYLNASEVRPLMTSDAKGLMTLWRIKTGRELPEDLDWVWAVGVGQRTEDYQLDWRERNGGISISRRQHRV